MSGRGARPWAVPHRRPAMHSLCLRPGISFGRIQGDLVFLDIERDRYFTLRGEAARLFKACCETDVRDLDPKAKAHLLATGLMEEVARGVRPVAARAEIPLKGLFELPGEQARPGILAALEIAGRLVPIRRALARAGVARRVRRIESMKTGLRPAHGKADLLKLARRFNAARPLVPVTRNCLSDSLACLEFLLSRRAWADLVFGVKLSPFAAHAWVQTDDLILNDHVDYVSEYTPVLVA